MGENTKFFSGTALRLREQDFKSWPISYRDLAPWYEKAETLLEASGRAGVGPTEPPEFSYLLPPMEHEPAIAALAEALTEQGLHPFPLPLSINSGRCRKGSPCDGFPCLVREKGDAETRQSRALCLALCLLLSLDKSHVLFYSNRANCKIHTSIDV